MNVHKLKLCANADEGTGFTTLWNDRVVIATCDHLFVGVGPANPLTLDLEVDGQRYTDVEVRRHAHADVAVILLDIAPPLPTVQTTLATWPASSLVIAHGYPVGSHTLQRQVGPLRGIHGKAQTYRHWSGLTKAYDGLHLQASFARTPGLSGGPVAIDDARLVCALYASWGGSTHITDSVHAGYIQSIA